MNRSSNTEEQFDENYTGRYLITNYTMYFLKEGAYKHCSYGMCS